MTQSLNLMRTSPPQSKKLFTEPAQPADVYIAHVDGAARGNPGPASYGVVLRRPDGSVLESLGKALGVQTNNVAEYHGLIAALDFAAARGIRRLRVRSDSLLLVQQVRGFFKVKNAALKPLHERVMRLKGALEYFAIEHVRREQNSEADAVANAALDARPVGAGFSPAARGESAQEAAGSETRKSKSGNRPARSVRARYSNGALHPAEPLALAQGEEVELVIRPLKAVR